MQRHTTAGTSNNTGSSSSSPVFSSIVPLTEMAQFTPFPPQFVQFRLFTFFNSGHPTSSNQPFLYPFPLASTRFSSRFLLPLTSKSRATLQTYHTLLTTCLYYLTPFAVANPSTASFYPNMSICSSVVFLSTTFQLHMALTIALSVLLKVASIY